MAKDLSIIITSYNTKNLTVECIKSILENTEGVNYEIIVVDNASTDGSAVALRKLQNTNRKLQIIENKKNQGFAKGNNQGVEQATGKFILLLNSDTKLTSDVISPALEYMRSNPQVGIFSCGLKNKDGTIQPTGGYFPTLPRIFAWMFFIDDIPFVSSLITSYHPKASFYNKSRDLDWVTGAFFLTRREVWVQNRGLDEGYFMYVEEMDFCFRAKRAGWKVFYDPKESIIHFGGASSSSSYPILSEFKGLKRFYEKFFPGWKLYVLRIMLKLGALARMIVFGLFKGPTLFRTYKNAFEFA